MLGKLVIQTWRSIVSVFISFALLIGMLLYTPNELLELVKASETIKDWLVTAVQSQNDPQAEILSRTMLDEGSITMSILFLVSRIFILTLILFIWNLLWEMVFGRRRENY